MAKHQKNLERPLSALDVIFTRRSVRAYTRQKLDQTNDSRVAGCRRALFFLHRRDHAVGTEFPKAVTVSSPILSIVRPCFGQTCIECLGLSTGCKSDRLLGVILDWKRSSNEYHHGPESK